VLIVERDGGVYSCDHYVSPRYRIGDIHDTGLAELAGSPAQIRFGENKRGSLPGQCLSCPCLPLCNGGCPKDRFSHTENGEPYLNYLCGGLQRFFTHARPTLEWIIQQTGMGRAPETMMADLREQSRAMWKGVGRNGPCPCGSGKKAKNCCWDKRP
jgi:uncharacterized protein